MVLIYIILNILIITGQCLCLKYFNTLGLHMYLVGKMFQYPQFVTTDMIKHKLLKVKKTAKTSTLI